MFHVTHLHKALLKDLALVDVTGEARAEHPLYPALDYAREAAVLYRGLEYDQIRGLDLGLFSQDLWRQVTMVIGVVHRIQVVVLLTARLGLCGRERGGVVKRW